MVSTAAISQYLEGLDFPVSKQDVVQFVQRKNAPSQIIDTLQKMPGEQYSSMAGIWHAVGRIS